jgi:hypothetical protein
MPQQKGRDHVEQLALALVTKIERAIRLRRRLGGRLPGLAAVLRAEQAEEPGQSRRGRTHADKNGGSAPILTVISA